MSRIRKTITMAAMKKNEAPKSFPTSHKIARQPTGVLARILIGRGTGKKETVMAEKAFATTNVKSGIPRNPGNPRTRVKKPLAMTPGRTRQPVQKPGHNTHRYDVTETNIYGP